VLSSHTQPRPTTTSTQSRVPTHQHTVCAEVLLQLQSRPVYAAAARPCQGAASSSRTHTPQAAPLSLWTEGCKQLERWVPGTHCNGLCMLMRQHTLGLRGGHSTHSAAAPPEPRLMTVYVQRPAVLMPRGHQRTQAGRHKKKHTYCTCRPAAAVCAQTEAVRTLLLPLLPPHLPRPFALCCPLG
jgi:hypothetical protein